MKSFRRGSTLHAAARCMLMLSVVMSMLSSAAFAAAPQMKYQGPGFYRLMLGKFEVTALLDGTHPFPIDTVVEGVSRDEIARDLARDFLSAPVQGSINAFLINTGIKLILIDSGAGVLYGDCCGKLLANLRAAGYRPEQIDEVLLTHLHKDHVGGIVANGAPAFPNAIVRASRSEADYWVDPANRSKAPDFLGTFFDAARASIAPYAAAGRFKPFDGDVELDAGIRALALPGHTPGHTGYLVESGGQHLLVWGDIVHVAAIQLQNPTASVEYDSDAAAAQASRRRALELAADQRYLIGAAHIAFPGLGHIRRNGATYDWVPVNYEAAPGP
ncbi:MBL fold metallo-hydrolase [bacterium M00.F.Ca.ET.228.01.1.1]|uniref:MBL fold metallo-hydrolase n=2 Tax=Pseudomonadota TaxID=1224 RepID=UPI00109199A3|nr:MBL fold metallo-hydrolase [Paraburkholderia phenoliruptrix]TGP40010.1 MBL fold metallo-hydrolase [bacterium M00.F.Ca.ET.228.01.1.1]TGR95944.1 MBL fold metallo-hydrolase [bacterium M00.F.Ca.ET.191.01.1.1]TGT97049.1 MBL fold metallo-hydrolase [bacterium M00.F.Ca.ET.155.01.1.1]MBW0448720.1 MBL fold metallo-hydrolase [Paraburkholderia phenoliruptrix]MBW9100418.1 MBL fold metallo-hydrolase [Paraburkholderia phenoliruptrix]